MLMKSLCILMLSGVAFATTVNFDSPTGALGTSETYSGVTLYGFSNTLTPTDLFGKHDGGDENGVGLNRFTDNEITGNGFIQINVTGFTDLLVEMGSTTGRDEWRFSESNTLGVVGTSLRTGNSEGVFVAVTDPDTYLTISSVGGESSNVLLGALNYTVPCNTTPEPNALFLAGAGLGFILLSRFKRSSKV